MKIIGLSGGIASGKSTAAKFLVERGIALIDCDVVARDVVKKGTWGYRRVVAIFSGKDILLPSGELDRDAIGRIIFQDVNARRKMNRATHVPVLFGILRHLLFNWVCMRRVVVLDMPLLFETGFYHVTKPNNILIACSKETQLSRLVSRDGLNERDASARIESQMPIELKRKKADIIIDNDGAASIDTLKESITRAVEEIRRKSWFQSLLTSPIGFGLAVFLAARMIFPGS